MIFIPQGRLGQKNTGLAWGYLTDLKFKADCRGIGLHIFSFGVEVT